MYQCTVCVEITTDLGGPDPEDNAGGTCNEQ